MSLTGDPTCDQVIELAAKDETLSDDVFLIVRRALAGLDPITGEPITPSLPARMTGRAWQRTPFHKVEVGREAGWFWRCPRRSCPVWGGPFDYEHEAYADGDERHGHAHRRGLPDRKQCACTGRVACQWRTVDDKQVSVCVRCGGDR